MRVYPSDNPVSSFFGISSNCLKWNGQSFESPKHGISPFTPRMHKVTLIRRLCLLPQRPQGTISEFSNLYKPRIMNQTQRESIWCITAKDLWPWMPIDACFVTTNLSQHGKHTHILASFAKRESLDPVHPLSISRLQAGCGIRFQTFRLESKRMTTICCLSWWRSQRPNRQKPDLVGGWTNPFEKY